MSTYSLKGTIVGIVISSMSTRESPWLLISALKNMKWGRNDYRYFFSKSSREMYSSATDIWSLIDITRRRKPRKDLKNGFSRKKSLKIIFFFSKREEEIQRTWGRKKGSIGKHRVGSKLGQRTRRRVDDVGICRHGKKLNRFSVCKGGF